MFVLNAIATILVTACWPFYLALFRRRFKQDSTAKRDLSSTIGICLQFGGVFLMCWHRPLFSPLISSFPLNTAAPIAAVLLATGSVWFSYVALNALGPQWSLVARIGGNHQLVREGVYGMVRHPLYLFFFGLTVATGMVWATPFALMIGAITFLCGVAVRVHAEEKLLRQHFGTDFDDYVRRVPAFFPRLRQ
jgi:protein-S-isoprenylcysteine O-methyltransferase Ste14